VLPKMETVGASPSSGTDPQSSPPHRTAPVSTVAPARGQAIRKTVPWAGPEGLTRHPARLTEWRHRPLWRADSAFVRHGCGSNGLYVHQPINKPASACGPTRAPDCPSLAARATRFWNTATFLGQSRHITPSPQPQAALRFPPMGRHLPSTLARAIRPPPRELPSLTPLAKVLRLSASGGGDP
jgi:hypothetical protein